MYLTKEVKKEIFVKYGNSNINTGNVVCQISLFTFRINYLSNYLKIHKKDINTKRALVKIVGKRRKLLRYIEKVDKDTYKYTIKELGIRK